MKNQKTIKPIIFFILMFLSLAMIFAIIYIRRNFVLIDTNPLAQILFHCIVQIDGADPTFIKGIIKTIVLVPLFLSVCATILVFGRFGFLERLRKVKILDFVQKNSILISLLFLMLSSILLGNELKVIDYIDKYTHSSTLYEDEYVDPALVEFEFPEKKRNLIYIFLESVETSDYSKALGGALDYNCIPELYEIAQENITFNDNKGFYVPPGASWTVAAMIAQSSGIPLNIPIGENDFVTSNKYMPGAYSIGQILEKGGYHNELLIGSEAVFSGRKYYYEMHGNYEIHDFDYFIENNLFDYEKRDWWGIVDRYLFDFAKQDLLELASKDEPFNLTLLTVDTHHQDGWVCEDCKDEYPDQLGNVYACSSRKVKDLIDWCKQQDFYENTTIIIAGDHCSMSTHFSEVIGDFDRRVYFTVINPADGCVETENRVFSTFDLYPTTVSALGIKYEGNKLGLGVDLFSNEETLCEKYGKGDFFAFTGQHSTYYDNHILYGFD